MMNPIFISFLTIARKECHRIVRMLSQTVFPPVMTMALYFIIFGSFIGRHMENIDGFTFMDFIAPGLIMMSAVTTTYANTATSLFMEKFQRSIETLLMAPITPSAMLWGYITGGVLRGFLTGILTSLVAAYFTDLTFEHYFVIFFGLLLIFILLSMAGFLNGLLAKKWDDVGFVPTFVLVPLTYLGGVFYPIEQLSPLWQKISYFNPIVYMIDVFRYGMLGFEGISIHLALSVLFVMTAVLYVLIMWMLHRGIGLKA